MFTYELILSKVFEVNTRNVKGVRLKGFDKKIHYLVDNTLPRK